MTDAWYFQPAGADRQGPVPLTLLQTLARTGGLAPADLVWKNPTDKPTPARSLDKLFPSSQTPTTKEPNPTFSDPHLLDLAASNGMIAGLLTVGLTILFIFIALGIFIFSNPLFRVLEIFLFPYLIWRLAKIPYGHAQALDTYYTSPGEEKLINIFKRERAVWLLFSAIGILLLLTISTYHMIKPRKYTFVHMHDHPMECYPQTERQP